MIADRIRELRLKNGIKQTELAKTLGLSRSAINAWEMGVSVPSTQYLIDLSKLFRVSTDHLLGREEKEMVDVSDLSESDKAMVYGLVRRLREGPRANETLHEDVLYETERFGE